MRLDVASKITVLVLYPSLCSKSIPCSEGKLIRGTVANVFIPRVALSHCLTCLEFLPKTSCKCLTASSLSNALLHPLNMPLHRRDSKMVKETSQPLIKEEPTSPTLAPQLLTPPSSAINIKSEPFALKSEVEASPTVAKASKRKRPATPDDSDDEPTNPVPSRRKFNAAVVPVKIAPKPPTTPVSSKKEVGCASIPVKVEPKTPTPTLTPWGAREQAHHEAAIKAVMEEQWGKPASIPVKTEPKTPTPTPAEREATAKRARQDADHDATLRAALLEPLDTPMQWKRNWKNWIYRNKRRNPETLNASQTTCINVSKSEKYFCLNKNDLECLAFESRPNPKDPRLPRMRLYDYNEVVRLACRKLAIQAGISQRDETALIARGKAMLEKKKGFKYYWEFDPSIVWMWG